MKYPLLGQEIKYAIKVNGSTKTKKELSKRHLYKPSQEVKPMKGEKCSLCFWTVCQCSIDNGEISFLQESQVERGLKVKGGGRPAKTKVPKLRIVQSDNETVDLITIW